jgi:hypothetical protein
MIQDIQKYKSSANERAAVDMSQVQAVEESGKTRSYITLKGGASITVTEPYDKVMKDWTNSMTFQIGKTEGR